MNPPRPAAVPPTPASHAHELYGRYFQGLDTDQKLAERMAVLYRANPVERQYIDTHLAYLATQQMGRIEQLATAQLQATRQAVALLQRIAGTGTDVVDGLELVLGVLNRAPELEPGAEPSPTPEGLPPVNAGHHFDGERPNFDPATVQGPPPPAGKVQFIDADSGQPVSLDDPPDGQPPS